MKGADLPAARAVRGSLSGAKKGREREWEIGREGLRERERERERTRKGGRVIQLRVRIFHACTSKRVFLMERSSNP